jgi:pimeloyl-ACP methyl ester carboxylesterase
MNPMFLDAVGQLRQRRSIGSLIAAPFRLAAWVLLTDVIFWKREKMKMEDGSALLRLLHGLVYRMLLVPICLIFLLAALVYIATHPPYPPASPDPQAIGFYYDPVSLTTADGVPLEAWLVPLLDARLVIEKKEQALRDKQPAVILVHDYGRGRGQMLPLVKPLHEAGYVVLIVGQRGNGAGAASTFGLRESVDVLAAMEMLRRRPGIDTKRIAVLGVGTGATAALLAAERDGGVAALILDHPIVGVEQVLEEYLGPPQPWLRSLRPLCKWAFELAYRVDADDLELPRHDKTMTSRPMLMFSSSNSTADSLHPRGQQQIRAFLEKAVPPTVATTAGTDTK